MLVAAKITGNSAAKNIKETILKYEQNKSKTRVKKEQKKAKKRQKKGQKNGTLFVKVRETHCFYKGAFFPVTIPAWQSGGGYMEMLKKQHFFIAAILLKLMRHIPEQVNNKHLKYQTFPPYIRTSPPLPEPFCRLIMRSSCSYTG